MTERSVLVCLGTLATSQSNHVIYDEDFGPCSIFSTSRGTGDERYQLNLWKVWRLKVNHVGHMSSNPKKNGAKAWVSFIVCIVTH